MAVSMRAASAQVSSVRRSAPRASVRPAASLKPAQLGAGLAAFALATCIVAPAEAHNLISTVASATEGYPFVPPSWAPQVLVPLTGLVIPAVAMASLFVYIESDKVEAK